MTINEYKVTLESFEGPLDLLLFLIRKSEVEITDIPMAKITQQYLEYVRGGTEEGGIERIDIETAGEFLVMAATLMEIKSRMLTPAPATAGGAADATAPAEAEDPRADLVRQLLAYKKYRDAASALEERRGVWERRFAAGAAGAMEAPASEDAQDETVDMADVDLVDLVRAFAAIIEAVDFGRVGEHHVRDDETPIELHAEDLVDRLRREAESGGAEGGRGGLELRAVFAGRTRLEAIGLFLALLELVRQRRVSAVQEGHGGIVVKLVEEGVTAENAEGAEKRIEK